MDVITKDLDDHIQIAAISHVTDEQMAEGRVPGTIIGRAGSLWGRIASFIARRPPTEQ